jgi:hypothetical protein
MATVLFISPLLTVSTLVDLRLALHPVKMISKITGAKNKIDGRLTRHFFIRTNK